MINIDSPELSFKFVRSSGAGGQNVNKVATKAVLTWDIENSQILTDAQKQRFLHHFGGFVTHEGLVIISSQKYRTQLKNKEDAYLKLISMIEDILPEPKKRIKTKVSKAQNEARLKEKRFKSDVKNLRKEIRDY